MKKTLKPLFKSKTIGNFGGVKSLQNSAKRVKNVKIKEEDVKRFLEAEDGYTLNREVRKPSSTKKVIVGGPSQLHQADLMDMSSLKEWNNGVTFLLLIIDVFSKYIWIRPLQNKSNKEVLNALKSVYTSEKDFPSFFSTDKGLEFRGKMIQNFFKEHSVQYFNSQGNTKAQFAERMIRTLKHKIFVYMTTYHTRSYLSILQTLAYTINHTQNRATGTYPANVSTANAKKVYFHMYGPTFPDVVKKILPTKEQIKNIKLEVGDYVRIGINKGIFEKRYDQTFSNEVFQIKKVKLTNPIMYVLEDLLNEEISGKFYSEELQKVDKNSVVFYVESILKEYEKNGTKLALVHWKYYGDKFDSVVPLRSIRDL